MGDADILRQVQSDSLDVPPWRVAACSLVGPSHVQRGAGCDDAFAWARNGDWLVLCVSDGAGSARFGAIGSEQASRLIVEAIAGRVAELAVLGDQVVIDAIAGARAHLQQLAAARDARLEDFHATVVGAIVNRRGAILFHIGDGAALALRNIDGKWTDVAISRPVNGEYSNETYFLTLERWRDYLRITPVDTFDALLLMTDGVTPFVLDRYQKAGASPFLNPLLTTLEGLAPEVGMRALRKLLARDDVRAACDDDKTLLWLSNGVAPAAAVAPASGEGPDVEAKFDRLVVMKLALRRRQVREAQRGRF